LLPLCAHRRPSPFRNRLGSLRTPPTLVPYTKRDLRAGAIFLPIEILFSSFGSCFQRPFRTSHITGCCVLFVFFFLPPRPTPCSPFRDSLYRPSSPLPPALSFSACQFRDKPIVVIPFFFGFFTHDPAHAFSFFASRPASSSPFHRGDFSSPTSLILSGLPAPLDDRLGFFFHPSHPLTAGPPEMPPDFVSSS